MSESTNKTSYHCSQHGKFSLDFCPMCPPAPYAAPVVKTGSARISLTKAELQLLIDYWPGDVEAMGDGDANLPPGEIPMQPVGRRIMQKLFDAHGKV